MTTARREQLNQAWSHLCVFGLQIRSADVPPATAEKQLRTLDRLLDVFPLWQLNSAMRYGMRRVWPFSEDGRPWDANDLSRNILKAIGAANRVTRRGEVPFNAQKIVAEGGQ